jgi:hypothetical protein
MEVILDDKTHRYFLHHDDGRIIRLPNNGKILEYAGYKKPMGRWVRQEHLDRGTDVHDTIHKFLIDEDMVVTDEVRPYFDCFMEFYQKNQPVTLETEKIIWSYDEKTGIGYAGKFDWLSEIRKQKWLIDFKSGASSPGVEMQLASYGYPDLTIRLGALYLKDKPRLVPVTYERQKMLYIQWEAAVRKYWKDHIFVE